MSTALVAVSDVSAGARRGWGLAFNRPWEPAPPPPQEPLSVIGRHVADMLASLRQDRAGSPMRQASAPRKARKRRDGEMAISKYGDAHGLGPRQVRKVLRNAGLLQTEIVVRGEHGNGRPTYLHTTRLTPDAVMNGLGRRLEPHNGTPYDVLTRKGQEWADKVLEARSKTRKVSPRHAVKEIVRDGLAQGKTQAEIVRLTGLSRALVSYHAGKLAA